MKRKIAAILAVMMTLQMGAVVSADVVQNEEGIRFKLENGKYASGWISKDDNIYYFNKDGYALQGWYKINDETYYFDHNGVMANGLCKVKDTFHYFNKGKLVKGMFITITEEDDEGNEIKKKYYTSSTGRVATGWRNLKGRYYYFDRSTGVMTTGWAKIGNNYYYFGTDGKMYVDKVTIGDKVYTFAPNGKYTGIEGEDVGVVSAPVADTEITTGTNEAVKPVETPKQETEKPDKSTEDKAETEKPTTETEKPTEDKAETEKPTEDKAETEKPTTETEKPADTPAKPTDDVVINVPDDAKWNEYMATPQITMMIQMVENYTQVELNDKGKVALAMYVNTMIGKAKKLNTIDAAWYMAFIDGAFTAVGAEFPADKRAQLIAKLKKQTDEDFKTIHAELIK